MSITAVVLIILIGIILLLIEFLIIPGVTVAGIGGFICIVGGVIASYHYHGVKTGNITLMITSAAFLIFVILALRTRTWNAVMLKENIEGKTENLVEEKILNVGDKGVTVSRLAPMGKALFKDKIVEAKSEEGFVNENTEIEITKILNTSVIVKPLKK